MMDKAQVIRELIRRTKDDFVAYFAGTPLAERAALIVELAISGDARLAGMRQELTAMIPDTENDGSWQCSYALNTGVMIESLLEYQATGETTRYDTAVRVFFDSLDFRVQQDMEGKGISRPTEEEIAAHPLFVREQAWFDQLTSPE